MRAIVVFAMLAACGGGGGGSGDDGDDGDDTEVPDARVPVTGDGLVVDGNHIEHTDGTRFHGRGANLHDERQCSSCSFAPRDPDGVDRWSDELLDGWGANFVRFLLTAKAAPYNEYEQQWQNLVDDPQYLADIVQNVSHMTAKDGVYVLVTLFADDTMKPENGDYDSEWPSSAGDTNTRYAALAEAFADDPKVLFGLTNEPHTTRDHAPELAAVYQDAIAAIRAVEDARGVAHHVVVVQAPEGWSRDLTYFVENPLDGDQIAYEVHPYNHADELDALLTVPAQTLPIIIGEYGPTPYQTDDDIRALWTLAQAQEIPYLAWNFHGRCSPTMLQDTATDGCGLDEATGYAFPRTAWGDLFHEHLATPW